LPDIELTIDGKKTIIKGKKEKVLPQTKPTDLRLKPIKPAVPVIKIFISTPQKQVSF